MSYNLKKTLLYILTIMMLIVAYVFFPDNSSDNSVNSGTDSVTGIVSETADDIESESGNGENNDDGLKQDGEYLSRDDVALYIHIYGELPPNFLTKNEARILGWDSSLGNLWDVRPGCAIGGDRFYNYEGLLPEADGRIYYECDVNYNGGYRGAERIVFSNDGIVYYTADHYESFELLYGGYGE